MCRSPGFLAPLAVALLVSAAVRCQHLVADLRLASSIPPSGNPTGFCAVPGFAAFRGTTADSGTEPWVTDGTAAGTFRLRDLVPGSGSSNPTMLGDFHGQVLFSAVLPGSGYGLFLTDGTTAGTHAIADLGIGGTASSLVSLANGNVLLVASNGVYETDLTPAGTHVIPGMQQFVPGIVLNGQTLGTCQGTGSTFDLWSTDGTVAGSRLVQAAVSTLRPTSYVLRNGRVCFVEVASGSVVWIDSTDGIAGVTRHVSLGTLLVPQPGALCLSGNRLILLMRSLAMSQLYTSDLTAAGTAVVPTPCQDLGELTEYGGALYLRGTTATQGYELWTTDGTTAGTTLVADLVPGVDGSHPESLQSTPNGLFYRSRDGQGGYLMRLLTSPTNLRSLGPIASGALSTSVVAWQDGLLFANTDAAGTELWFGGATRNVAMVRDLDANGPGLVMPVLRQAAVLRDRSFCAADDGVHGMEVVASDGTAAGTRVLDLTPGITGSQLVSTRLPRLASYRDRMVVCGPNGVALTDGTPGNLVTLYPNSSGPVRVVDQLLYFVYSNQVLRSDGTPAGTVPATTNSTISTIEDFQVMPGRFALLSGARNLWGTDGPSYLELLVPSVGNLLGTFGGRCVVTSDTGIHRTDGTAAGTVQLAAGVFNEYTPFTSGPTAGYAMATDGTVWQSDGTAAGTSIVAPAAPGMTLESLLATEHELFAVATTATTGRELWKLDRQAHQFVLVADLAPGAISGVAAASVLGRGDLVFLAAGDDATGSELYVSNGTAAGTTLVADLAPGRGSSNPRLVGIADSQILFTADDGIHGSELFAMPISLVGAANEQELGSGCVGSAGIPTLATAAVARLGSTGFGYRAARLPLFAPALFGIATDDASVPFGGCMSFLGGAVASQFRLADAAGTASVSLPVPANNTLVGLRLVAQVFALDGLVPAGFSASSGRLVVVGR